MNRAYFLASLVLCVPLFSLVLSCQTAPVTGRSQFILISEAQEKELGHRAYQDVLKNSRLSHDQGVGKMVEKVGRKLASVAEKPDYQWEFAVIDDEKMVNAFALPGGKVAVYTGILPVTRDDTGLAVVLGHEIGHALARHGAERISTQLVAQIGFVGVMVAMRGGDPQVMKGVQAAFGIGVILPFSRAQESEADRIGLILMAKAGYDPNEAVGFWERMAQAKKGKEAPPEFLSTHPSDETRIEQIKSWLPEAVEHYKKAGAAVTDSHSGQVH